MYCWDLGLLSSFEWRIIHATSTPTRFTISNCRVTNRSSTSKRRHPRTGCSVLSSIRSCSSLMASRGPCSSSAARKDFDLRICCLWSSCSLPWCSPVCCGPQVVAGNPSYCQFFLQIRPCHGSPSPSGHLSRRWRVRLRIRLGTGVSWTPFVIVVMSREICWPNWFRTAIKSFTGVLNHLTRTEARKGGSDVKWCDKIGLRRLP